MIYVTSVLFGIGAAIAAALLWILAVFVLPIVVPFALSRVTGAGGVGAASIDSASILVAALVHRCTAQRPIIRAWTPRGYRYRPSDVLATLDDGRGVSSYPGHW